jgi:hypothetical protein
MIVNPFHRKLHVLLAVNQGKALGIGTPRLDQRADDFSADNDSAFGGIIKRRWRAPSIASRNG